jgi:hypothetical protein
VPHQGVHAAISSRVLGRVQRWAVPSQLAEAAVQGLAVVLAKPSIGMGAHFYSSRGRFWEDGLNRPQPFHLLHLFHRGSPCWRHQHLLAGQAWERKRRVLTDNTERELVQLVLQETEYRVAQQSTCSFAASRISVQGDEDHQQVDLNEKLHEDAYRVACSCNRMPQHQAPCTHLTHLIYVLQALGRGDEIRAMYNIYTTSTYLNAYAEQQPIFHPKR